MNIKELKRSEFKKDLTQLLNYHGIDNELNIDDNKLAFIIIEFLNFVNSYELN